MKDKIFLKIGSINFGEYEEDEWVYDEAIRLLKMFKKEFIELKKVK